MCWYAQVSQDVAQLGCNVKDLSSKVATIDDRLSQFETNFMEQMVRIQLMLEQSARKPNT